MDKKNNSAYVFRNLQDDFFEHQSQLDELKDLYKILFVYGDSKGKVNLPIYLWLNEKSAHTQQRIAEEHNKTSAYFDEMLGQFPKYTIDDLYQFINKKIAGADHIVLYSVTLQQNFKGIVLFEKIKERDPWNEVEKGFLKALSLTISHATASISKGEFYLQVTQLLDRIMNQMNDTLFISDVQTDEILYANQTMKETLGDAHPEGKFCWEVISKNKTERCAHCPKPLLLQSNEENPIHIWEAVNPKTNQTYENYDSLTRWIDGRIVHFQHSIDISETKRLSRALNYDVLTKAYSRARGKALLSETITKAKAEDFIFSLCMIDINDLKLINDTYGHEQGDNLIVSIIDTIRKHCNDDDFVCRLSGDEFFIVFLHYTEKEAHFKMGLILDALKDLNLFPSSKRSSEFSYGVVQVNPQDDLDTKQLLGKVDENLYTNKKLYHIQRSNIYLDTHGIDDRDANSFIYDKDLLYPALMNSTDDYIYICNMKTGVFCYSQAMVDEFGLPGRVINNAAAVWGLKVHEDDKQKFLESNQEVLDGRCQNHMVEYRAKNREGKWMNLRCRGKVMCDQHGEMTLFAGFISNLSKRNEIDHITGLYNKFSFQQAADHLYKKDIPFALVLLNIDNFKHINSLNNRTFGDEVLRYIAQKIHSLLSPNQTIYRLDGDEFGIISKNSTKEDVMLLYQRIQSAFQSIQSYQDTKFYISLSSGCAFSLFDADSFEDLNKYADYALIAAKNKGKNCIEFFTKSILYKQQRILDITRILRESIDNDFKGFELHFQCVNRNDRSLFGVESLARFHCDVYGSISPIEFIPILEETGLIVPFGKWAFEESVKTVTLFHQYQDNLLMGVNLSVRQLKQGDFVPFAKDILKKYNIDGSKIIVELTESCIAENLDQLTAVLKDIRNSKMKIAMDDFGTGYSSLGLLKAIPLDFIKIDRTFVQGIKQNTFDRAFIKLVAEMCPILNIESLLEGVEEEDEYEVCSQLPLDYFQGYLFSKPVNKEDFIKQFFTQKEHLSKH